MKSLLLCSFVFVLVFTARAHAFPELVRHGYPNCMTCHVSPTGGGVLSEYGRALSKELLSTWGREGEEKFLWFHATTSKVALGGDLRVIHIKDKTPVANRERTIFMQRDFEAALTLGRTTVASTFGTHDPRLQNENEFISRRHFVIQQATDEVSIRGGRFYPAFGLYLPEHVAYVRRGLGWDQGMESYNLEVGYQSERWSHFATAILGRPDDPSLNREKGAAISSSYNPTDKSKVGMNYYYGESDEIIRHFVGPHAIIGFTEHFYLLSQFTFVRNFPYTAEKAQWGLVEYQKLGYEFAKGAHVLLLQEFSQTDFERHVTRNDALGVGFQFFPRPHFEFLVTWQKLYSQGLSGTPTDRLSLMAHFYL